MEAVGPATGVRVLLVDEHALFREGLALALAGVDDIEIAGEAADGQAALGALLSLSPDVVVMDVRMPDGTGPATIARLRGARPQTKVLVLTGSQDEGDLVDAVRSGATGYLLRDASVDAVAEAIRSVAEGMAVVSPLMTTKLLEQFGALLGQLPDWRRPQLTGREIDVLRLVVKGMPNREIATELFISQNTVKNHVRSILEKLRVRSKADAAVVATREGLLAVDATDPGSGSPTPADKVVDRMSMFQKLLHAGEGKKLKVIQSVVPAVAAFEPEMERRSDDELRALTDAYKSRIEQGEDLDDLLPEAFATVREAGRRVLGQRHFDVQVMGGAALHFGWIAEMKTGEGKTLVSTLPAYLNALTGRGVHLVTTNDYLARRDSQWMGRIHRFLGLEVGVVYPNDDPPDEKRKHYGADITYGTNNEFGFDYLRDNMCESREQQTQRGHYFAIVDEVDSILIDEARTPLIISGQVAEAAEMYHQFARIVRGLQRERDYEVDEAKRTVVPTPEGIQRVEDALSIANLYDDFNQNYVHQIQAALRAKELFHRDDDYIVADGEVKIVDEFTGRILEGRRWSEGLHQAVEAKEGVRIKEENQTLATVTLQNYFRLYEKLAGMTGTAYTEAGEFAHTYDMSVVQVPTNQPMVRADQADLIYKTETAKYEAVVADLAERHETGQPVLVGTISVEQSEKLARLLEKKGVPHYVLNAKQHEREANIIAQAGQLYGVTVATNMAGRGVDILLGGNPEGLARTELQKEGITEEAEPDRYQQLVERFSAECAAEGEKVRELGGLYVLGTERHESRRIDNQLRGRAGRQGDPGESRFYLSLEDELMRLFATGLMSRVMDKAFPDDVPLEAKMVSKAIERAQHTVEDRNFEIRKDVLKYDEVMNEQRKIIYRRRQQILDGEDLREEALEAVSGAVNRLVDRFCPGQYAEEWDVDELLLALREYFPTRLTNDDIVGAENRSRLEELLQTEATELYEQREQSVTEQSGNDDAWHEIERRVMLAMIDQGWREHLYEMDYLQEGINLRAMGQKDPLSEWQREGFDMFEAMMGIIEDNFVRYMFHIDVQVLEQDERPRTPVRRLSYSAPDEAAQGSTAMQAASQLRPGEEAGMSAMSSGAVPSAMQTSGMQTSAPDAPVQPVRVEKTPGRNEPCWCGSGKKFKLCHGR